MLLSHKKTHGDEQNWCIVLNPLRSELDRKRVARKISEVFSLSSEEASDLVVNTPIILLDNLTRTIATKVKDYFLSTGAEIVLTNDVLVKRKCYRTVWPEPPSLSFLHDWNEPKETQSEQQEILEAEEALNEIRSLQHEDRGSQEQESQSDSDPEPVSETLALPIFSASERGQLLDEVDRWMRQCMSARQELEQQRQEFTSLQGDLERSRKEVARLNEAQKNPDPKIQQQERQAREAQVLLSGAEEKYEGLKEEYRDARKIFEERMLAAAQESQASRKKIGELDAEKDQLLHALKEEKDLRQKLEEESRQALKLSSDMTEKLSTLEKAKLVLDRDLRLQGQQLATLSEKYQSLVRKLDIVETAHAEEKSLRMSGEERQKDLEASQIRLLQEVETRTQEILESQAKMRDLEKAFGDLREAYLQQEKMGQANLRHIEMREKELESARKQLRDVNAQLEYRETIQRRAQILTQLTDKESRLKYLVKGQEKIESEIREREEEMKKILGEQETIEKEIVEAKQAQRHLLEQAKKDPRFPSKPEGARIELQKPEE